MTKHSMRISGYSDMGTCYDVCIMKCLRNKSGLYSVHYMDIENDDIDSLMFAYFSFRSLIWKPPPHFGTFSNVLY